MRVIAFDIGEKRIGIAVSDPSGKVATPVKVLDTATVLSDASVLRRLVADYEPGAFLVGLPLSLDGSEGPQAQAVRLLAARLLPAFDLPVHFADERFSSAEAKRVMSESGISERDQRGRLDAAAASIFLQAWLDGRGSAVAQSG